MSDTVVLRYQPLSLALSLFFFFAAASASYAEWSLGVLKNTD